MRTVPHGSAFRLQGACRCVVESNRVPRVTKRLSVLLLSGGCASNAAKQAATCRRCAAGSRFRSIRARGVRRHQRFGCGGHGARGGMRHLRIVRVIAIAMAQPHHQQIERRHDRHALPLDTLHPTGVTWPGIACRLAQPHLPAIGWCRPPWGRSADKGHEFGREHTLPVPNAFLRIEQPEPGPVARWHSCRPQL